MNHNNNAKDFDVLSQSINNLPKNLKSALSSHPAKLDKDKKCFTCLHPSVQSLILNACSSTGELPPKPLQASAPNFSNPEHQMMQNFVSQTQCKKNLTVMSILTTVSSPTSIMVNSFVNM
jgi:hypothetical protein